MKQATKMVLGAAAIVAVSAGVAGVTTYSMLKPEPNKSVAFNDVFQQNPNTRLAALDATQMQPVDLTQAAENSVHAVVHIKSTQESKLRQLPFVIRSMISLVIFWEWQRRRSAASGADS